MANLRNSRVNWGLVARILHWAMAVLIIGMIGYGLWMTSLDDPYAAFGPYQTHKSFGLVAFALILLRLAWRAFDRTTPAEPPSMPRWQRAAARASHILLYALMAAMPISGFLMASASPLNAPTRLFGGPAMPDPLGPSKAVEDFFKETHELLAWTLIVVISVHVLAALKHAMVDRDGVLRRMTLGAPE